MPGSLIKRFGGASELHPSQLREHQLWMLAVHLCQARCGRGNESQFRVGDRQCVANSRGEDIYMNSVLCSRQSRAADPNSRQESSVGGVQQLDPGDWVHSNSGVTAPVKCHGSIRYWPSNWDSETLGVWISQDTEAVITRAKASKRGSLKIIRQGELDLRTI
jgi:hypothetical protein